MTQFEYIKDIAKFGLENDQEKLLSVLNELIEYSKKTKKINFALQLQSLLKEAIQQKQNSGLLKAGSPRQLIRQEDREVSEFIIEKLTSDYRFDNLICTTDVREKLEFFVREHRAINVLKHFELPVSNKILLHGPSGCGKTLAAYILAGELEKMMLVVDLGAIVSSKLGETSKNLAKLFHRATAENSIIFIDEFDSLGKVRDYSQDHGEMKRVVNTILQLFDYLPQENIVIAATNQINMIDEALTRRFDSIIKLDLPEENQVRDLINLTLKNGNFNFDNSFLAENIIKDTMGLSYFSIQKSLITAIKKTLLSQVDTNKQISLEIKTDIWKELIEEEKKSLLK